MHGLHISVFSNTAFSANSPGLPCSAEWVLGGFRTIFAFLAALSLLAFLSSSSLTATRGPSSCFFRSSLQNSYVSSTSGNVTCNRQPAYKTQLGMTPTLTLKQHLQASADETDLSAAAVSGVDPQLVTKLPYCDTLLRVVSWCK